MLQRGRPPRRADSPATLIVSASLSARFNGAALRGGRIARVKAPVPLQGSRLQRGRPPRRADRCHALGFEFGAQLLQRGRPPRRADRCHALGFEFGAQLLQRGRPPRRADSSVSCSDVSVSPGFNGAALRGGRIATVLSSRSFTQPGLQRGRPPRRADRHDYLNTQHADFMLQRGRPPRRADSIQGQGPATQHAPASTGPPSEEGG